MRITDIDTEKHKVSLSIRALLEDPKAAPCDASDTDEHNGGFRGKKAKKLYGNVFLCVSGIFSQNWQKTITGGIMPQYSDI